MLLMCQALHIATWLDFWNHGKRNAGCGTVVSCLPGESSHCHSSRQSRAGTQGSFPWEVAKDTESH